MLNDAHLHLLVNHFPILGVVFSFLIVLYAFLRPSVETYRIASLLFVFSGIMSFVAYQTGGPAASFLKQYPEIVRSKIGAHAEFSDIALWVSLGTSAIVLIFLVVSYMRDRFPNWMRFTLLLSQLACIGLLSYASHLGALIRHVEIDPNPTQVTGTESYEQPDQQIYEEEVESDKDENERGE